MLRKEAKLSLGKQSIVQLSVRKTSSSYSNYSRSGHVNKSANSYWLASFNRSEIYLENIYIWKRIYCFDHMQMFVPVWTDAFELNFLIKMFIAPDVCTEHLSLCQQALNLGKWNFVPRFTLFILYPGSESSRTLQIFEPNVVVCLIFSQYLYVDFLHTENKAPHLACRNIYIKILLYKIPMRY